VSFQPTDLIAPGIGGLFAVAAAVGGAFIARGVQRNTTLLTGPPDNPKENGIVGDMTAMWAELNAQREANERCERENAYLRSEIARVDGRYDAAVAIFAKGVPQLVLPAEAEPVEEQASAAPARRPRRR
jgi:hypothetical protein